MKMVPAFSDPQYFIIRKEERNKDHLDVRLIISFHWKPCFWWTKKGIQKPSTQKIEIIEILNFLALKLKIAQIWASEIIRNPWQKNSAPIDFSLSSFRSKRQELMSVIPMGLDLACLLVFSAQISEKSICEQDVSHVNKLLPAAKHKYQFKFKFKLDLKRLRF